MKYENFEKNFDKITASSVVHECIVYVENTKGDFSWNKGYGNKDIESPLLMTSVSKLFTTTCILALMERGLLSLDDKLTKYFSNDVLNGLHVYKGKEYSKELTIENLLFQTSGFPDIYAVGKNSLNKKLIQNDIYISFEEYITLTKRFKKKFAPDTLDQAYYSDMNFEMLGEIIKKVINSTLHDAYKQFIFEPLKLEHTYLPRSEADFIPNIYYKDKVLSRPKLILSIPACGGCVSTAREVMIFIKAFFGGRLFDKAVFDKLESYKKLNLTMGFAQYGCGCMKISLKGLTTFFQNKGAFFGHIGMSGAFAFYYPVQDLYFVGDANQLARPGLTIQIPVRLAMSIKK